MGNTTSSDDESDNTSEAIKGKENRADRLI